MPFNNCKIFFKYLFLVTLLRPAFSQNAFDKMLEMDSLYRNNSSLESLDSLFINASRGKNLDTSFTNPYGKAELITLDQMIYFARLKNPDLSSMSYRIDALRVFGKSKSYLPDPMIEIETDDVASNFKKVGMINFYASQVFPYPGKLSLERESAMQNADMLEMEHHNMETELINMIKMNYYDLYLINEKLKINHENQQLLNTFSTAAESKYSVGKGMQQEVFKSQIEFSKLINEEKILNLQQSSILANLSRLTRTEINGNTNVSFKNIDIEYLLNRKNFDFENIDRDALVQYAFDKRADLRSIRNKILMKQTDIEISKINKYPDFFVQAGYKILPLEQHNGFEFMVGINVPIAPWSWGRYDVNIQRNILNMESSQQEYESKRIEIKNQVDTVLNSLVSLKGTMMYYHNVLIPQTENSLKATQYNYENNMTSFLDLLDSYRMLQESNDMFNESVNMYLKMIAELEKITGMNFKN
jgi:cobalt-zinc-cadmium efflux system outer membrane protein